MRPVVGLTVSVWSGSDKRVPNEGSASRLGFAGWGGGGLEVGAEHQGDQVAAVLGGRGLHEWVDDRQLAPGGGDLHLPSRRVLGRAEFGVAEEVPLPR